MWWWWGTFFPLFIFFVDLFDILECSIQQRANRGVDNGVNTFIVWLFHRERETKMISSPLEKIDDSLRSMSISFDKIAFGTDFSTFSPSMIYLSTLFFQYSHFGNFSFDIFSFGHFISNPVSVQLISVTLMLVECPETPKTGEKKLPGVAQVAGKHRCAIWKPIHGIRKRCSVSRGQTRRSILLPRSYRSILRRLEWLFEQQ